MWLGSGTLKSPVPQTSVGARLNHPVLIPDLCVEPFRQKQDSRQQTCPPGSGMVRWGNTEQHNRNRDHWQRGGRQCRVQGPRYRLSSRKGQRRKSRFTAPADDREASSLHTHTHTGLGWTFLWRTMTLWEGRVGFYAQEKVPRIIDGGQRKGALVSHPSDTPHPGKEVGLPSPPALEVACP